MGSRQRCYHFLRPEGPHGVATGGRCDISVSGYSPGLQRLCGVAAVRKTRDRAGSEVGTESPWLEGSRGMAVDNCYTF